MYDIFEVSGLVFEMMSSLEIYIIYCIALVRGVVFHLRLWTAHLSNGESMNEFASITVSACKPVIGFTLIETSASNVGNSDTLVSSSHSYKLTVGLQCKPPPLAKVWASESMDAQGAPAKESGQSEDDAYANWFGRSNW
jgi:hypothetical protein